ncbi:hypothetical protein EYF80_047168 [Liparis tanakae]|uniref:Uncharacterized protein n=1 Tax=Liparis tanakae TaxID=230148 RepID=A0A4Z2FQL7_9TELE|nr:hypothetical protein EYF80_047168 [Liparis tanakae]
MSLEASEPYVWPSASGCTLSVWLRPVDAAEIHREGRRPLLFTSPDIQPFQKNPPLRNPAARHPRHPGVEQ